MGAWGYVSVYQGIGQWFRQAQGVAGVGADVCDRLCRPIKDHAIIYHANSETRPKCAWEPGTVRRVAPGQVTGLGHGKGRQADGRARQGKARV